METISSSINNKIKIHNKSENNSNINVFSEYKLGDQIVKNRVAMAALTRVRCDPETGVPNDLHVKYYSQRAEDAGFVLTECAAISKDSNSFPGSACIYSKEQIQGWKKVIDKVHEKNNKIFIQIWHCGRSVHKKLINGHNPLAPSSIQNRHKGRTPDGFIPYDQPVEMSIKDIEYTLDLFEKAAYNALEAGFDGIELHGANGYLIDNFLRDASNQRTDDYGGCIENRCKFPLQVIDRLIKVFGPSKVGIKISPCGRLNDMFDSNPEKLYSYFLRELSKKKIAFVEVMKAPEFRKCENFYGVKGEDQIKDMFEFVRKHFDYNINNANKNNNCFTDYKPTIIGNNSIDFKEAEQLIHNKIIDMVSFGRNYISNPDLCYRLKNKLKLTIPDYNTFYVHGNEGYNTYKTYNEIIND